MSIVLTNISYSHPDKEILFRNIGFTVDKGEKASIIGNNGSGKSTLLRIIGGYLLPLSGHVNSSENIRYIPQHFGQYDEMSVAEALDIQKKRNALHAILNGEVSEENLNMLNDDWNIEKRALSALSKWDLNHIELSEKMENLSGGEKTKVFLAGILIHEPSIILFDEPTNHLDRKSRKKLYDLIDSSKATILIVSHDRELLNLPDKTYELTKNGIELYGGNYEFYKICKEEKLNALHLQIEEKEKQLRMARKTAQEAAERKQKHESRGKKLNIKKGVGKMAMDTLQDKAEKSNSKLKSVHSDKILGIAENLTEFRNKLAESKDLKINFENTDLHKGKILVNAENINFGYSDINLWNNPLDFKILSGDKIVIKGNNGSGKTTLLRIITGEMEPKEGKIERTDFGLLYLDQEYSVINNNISVYEQAELFNKRKLPEHEIKSLLSRFLFDINTWDKKCELLSGGEKIKLLFCCLTLSDNIPDMFILDEPTNNLDIRSLEIIGSMLKNYKGTVLLISHDRYFIEEIGINKTIDLR